MKWYFFIFKYVKYIQKLLIHFLKICNDSSYAFNGRASLLVRYLEDGLKNDWREFELYNDKPQTENTNIKNSSFKVEQEKSMSETLASSFTFSQNKKPIIKKTNPKIMLFVIGGLTRAEISSIRVLHSDKVVLCASTAVITAKSLLNSFK